MTNKLRIYHGSTNIIKTPEFGKGNTSNDYGKGFYCTEHIELAKEWACAKNTDGFVNIYDLNMEDLRVLNLNTGNYSILNWIALLTRYRGYWQRNSVSEDAKNYLQEHFLVDIEGYDVIVGYRADDSYFSFAQDFIMNTISINQLEHAMKLGNLGEQIVLKGKKAFDAIKFVDYEEAYASEYFIKKVFRDKQARKQYRDNKKQLSNINDLYMLDIMRRGLSNDDFCL